MASATLSAGSASAAVFSTRAADGCEVRRRRDRSRGRASACLASSMARGSCRRWPASRRDRRARRGCPTCAARCRKASVTASMANFDALYAPCSGSTMRPPMEPTFTIRPPPADAAGGTPGSPRAARRGSPRAGVRRVVHRLELERPGLTIPALFTSPASPRSPTARATVSVAVVIISGSVMSMRSGVSSPDVCFASASASALRRTPAKTEKPRVSEFSAHAAPIPVDVPMISDRARCPNDRWSCGCLPGEHVSLLDDFRISPSGTTRGLPPRGRRTDRRSRRPRPSRSCRP